MSAVSIALTIGDLGQRVIPWLHWFADLALALSAISILIIIVVFFPPHSERKAHNTLTLVTVLLLGCAMGYGINHVVQHIPPTQFPSNFHSLAVLAVLVSVAAAAALYRKLSQGLAAQHLPEHPNTQHHATIEQLRHSAVEVQHRSDAILKFTLELLPTGLMVIDNQQHIVITNTLLAGMFGYTTDELIGKPLSMLVINDHVQHHHAFVKDYLRNPSQRYAMASGRVVRGRTRDNQEIAVEISISTHEFRGEQHAFASVASVDEVASGQSLANEVSNRIRRAVEATNDGIWEWNVQTNNVWYSARMLKMIGADPEKDEHHFELWLEHIHPEDRTHIQDQLAAHFNKHKSFDVIYRGLTESETYEWVHVRGNTVFDAKDRPLLMSGTLTNINEIKSLQEQLSTKGHFLDQLLNKTLCGTYIFNLKTNTNVFINPQYYEITGYTLADLKHIQESSNLMSLFHPDDHETIAAHIHEVQASTAAHGVAIEYRFKHKLGHWVWCYSKDSVYTRDESGNAIEMLGSFFDITELKQREQKIDRLAKDFITTFEQAAMGIAHVSFDGQWIKANQRLCDILRYPHEQLLQHNYRAITLDIDRDIDNQQFQQLMRSELEHYSVEKRFRRSDQAIIWVSLTISLVKRDNDDESHLILVVDDITQRKEVSRSLAESNASLERFAYSASHDLQEPLRKISAFSESLERRLSGKLDDPDARYELNRISNAAVRMRQMINSLLQLSRYTRQKIDRQNLSLQALVNQALDDLSTLIHENNATITVRGSLDLFVDSSAFQQVLRNLISNSIRYAQEQVAPNIVICGETVGSHARIAYSDNGKGFENQYAEQIFEPFKRLVGRDIPGSGMGLALCRQILLAHGGKISAKATPGEGTQFLIELPLISE